MIITASIKNSLLENDISVSTEKNEKKLTIAGKTSGRGSSVNGGELLFLSLATCFCNDIYREAARRKIDVENVEVIVKGKFGNEGEPASDITYDVKVTAPASSATEISELIRHVDSIAEVHNTLRLGVAVKLKSDSI